MYEKSILRVFDYPNTLSPELVQVIEVPLYTDFAMTTLFTI